MDLLCDPINGERLTHCSADPESYSDEIAVINSVDHVTDIYYSNVGYYAEFYGVVYLLKLFSSLDSLKEFDMSELSSSSSQDSLAWYEQYKEGMAAFKYSFFLDIFSKSLKKDMVVVDLISADGGLIKDLYAAGHKVDPSINYIATDIDFSALKLLKEANPNINCICADATKVFARESSIDLCFSNSIHHVPDASDIVFTNIENTLTKDGKFVGVESQGLLSRIIILVMFLLPKPLIPKYFSEIYDERHLIKKWLSTSIKRRLKVVRSPRILKNKLFHVFYMFEK